MAFPYWFTCCATDPYCISFSGWRPTNIFAGQSAHPDGWVLIRACLTRFNWIFTRGQATSYKLLIMTDRNGCQLLWMRRGGKLLWKERILYLADSWDEFSLRTDIPTRLTFFGNIFFLYWDVIDISKLFDCHIIKDQLITNESDQQWCKWFSFFYNRRNYWESRQWTIVKFSYIIRNFRLTTLLRTWIRMRQFEGRDRGGDTDVLVTRASQHCCLHHIIIGPPWKCSNYIKSTTILLTVESVGAGGRNDPSRSAAGGRLGKELIRWAPAGTFDIHFNRVEQHNRKREEGGPYTYCIRSVSDREGIKGRG